MLNDIFDFITQKKISNKNKYVSTGTNTSTYQAARHLLRNELFPP